MLYKYRLQNKIPLRLFLLNKYNLSQLQVDGIMGHPNPRIFHGPFFFHVSWDYTRPGLWFGSIVVTTEVLLVWALVIILRWETPGSPVLNLAISTFTAWREGESDLIPDPCCHSIQRSGISKGAALDRIQNSASYGNRHLTILLHSRNPTVSWSEVRPPFDFKAQGPHQPLIGQFTLFLLYAWTPQCINTSRGKRSQHS